MQLTSDNAKKSWINYIERVESQIQEDAASITKIGTTMDNVFQNWCASEIWFLLYWNFSLRKNTATCPLLSCAVQ